MPFMEVLGVQTQVLMLVQPAFYPLNHPSGPLHPCLFAGGAVAVEISSRISQACLRLTKVLNDDLQFLSDPPASISGVLGIKRLESLPC